MSKPPAPAETRSVYARAYAALRRGDTAAVRELTDQILDEAAEARDLFPRFIARARDYLLARGLAPEDLRAEEERLGALLDPDAQGVDAAAAWQALRAAAGEVVRCCADGRAQEAAGRLDEARRAWCTAHDRACDWVYGLLDVAFRRLGEEVIGSMWDALMGDLYATRDAYAPAVRPWPDSVQALLTDAVASLRGHLSGQARLGEVDVVEETDRWLVSFDPCGSGGRTHRPDTTSDGMARMEPPYDFAVTTGRHDWAWQREGVCLYCVHCCQLQERVPIRRFGIPLRVIDPPAWPGSRHGGKCTWSIYKRPEDIPASAYTRVGLQKPAPPATAARERDARLPTARVLASGGDLLDLCASYAAGGWISPDVCAIYIQALRLCLLTRHFSCR